MSHPKQTVRFLTALGAALRHEREKLGWSQEDLSLESQTDRTYISGIERGTRNPTAANLLRLCEAMGIRPSQVMRSAEHKVGM